MHDREPGDLRDPQNFATYEDFLAAFAELPTFSASDTPGGNKTQFDVLGDRAAEEGSADPALRPVARRNNKEGEEYINHPTAGWIAAHLPAELQRVVYQLPTDCADVAVMLRHVWNYAHGRTERIGKWVIGVGAGQSESARMDSLYKLVAIDVYSGSVSAVVGPAYYDDLGHKVLSYERLRRLLHPGDVLVWEHHYPPGDPQAGRRSGGHTQTIQTVKRKDGDWTRIESIDVVQGNEPIFEEQAQDIRAEEAREGQQQAAEGALRNLPGRRIERDTLSGDYLRDVGGVWTWPDEGGTRLIAAGPPSGVVRPPMGKDASLTARRHITDWLPALGAATAETLPGIFDAALIEARAGIEGGSRYLGEIIGQAPALGTAAGQRLLQLGLPGERQQDLLSQMSAAARALGADLNAGASDQAGGVFEQIAQDLEGALSAQAQS